mgnify:CR=1 FL=1
MLKAPNCHTFDNSNKLSQQEIDSNDFKSQKEKENENLKQIKSILDFISGKNKIILKSCFDRKGAKKFLYDKEKAMAEFVLVDETIDENLEDKRKRKSHRKNFIKDNKFLRSESENYFKIQKISSNIDKKVPNLKFEKTVAVTHFPRPKKNKGKKGKVDKRKVNKLSSITSNFSNIQCKEPLNLAISNNDSFIHSIINELVELKN